GPQGVVRKCATRSRETRSSSRLDVVTGSEVAAIVLLSAAFLAQVGGVGLIVWDIRDDLRQAREMAEVPIIPPESFVQQVSSSTFSFALPQSRDPAMELAQHQHRHATLFQKFVQDV